MDINTFNSFQQLLHIKRYSPNSINAYVGMLRSAQQCIGDKTALHRYDDHALLKLVIDIVNNKRYSYSSHKQLIATLSLYLKEVHRRDIDFSPVYPTRRPNKLPEILSKVEVKKLLLNTKNLKHSTILSTVYSLGLRSGELLSITIPDIKSDRKQLFVRSGKGKKDRVIPVPESILQIWRRYYSEYTPQHYLFEGQKGNRYSPQSLRKIFHQAKNRAGIKAPVSLHSLRHSYATHLMDAGTDVRLIKELLGHDNIKTTLVYTKVTDRTLSQIQNPFDLL